VNQVNVDNDGSKQNQAERDEASDKKEQASEDLEYGNDMKVMTHEKSFREVTDEPRRWRRHRNKMQKDVRPKHDKNEPEKNASDDRCDFHSDIVACLIRNSNLYLRGHLGGCNARR
jgi:hypothetical protein